MKFKMFLLILAIMPVVTVFTGCQKASLDKLVNIDYGQIAGTWKAEKGTWQVTISEEGRIFSAVHPLGIVTVKPNETVYTEMKDGSKSSYKGGDFTLVYEPGKRQIEVTINMKKIHVKFLDNEIKGHTETIIGGFVSDDFTVWDADIIEMFDYGPRFPQDEPGPVPMKFYKQK